MKLHSLCWRALLAAFCIAATATAGTASLVIVPSPSNGGGRNILAGSVPTQVAGLVPTGSVEPTRRIEGVTLVFRRSPAQQQALDALLAQLQDPHSVQFRHWLTPEEYAGRFGVSAATVQTVENWLASQNLQVTDVARGRQWVRFSGSAADISAALGTTLMQYSVGGELHIANSTPVRLPSNIAPAILDVRHLDDFRPVPMGLHTARKSQPIPEYTDGSGNYSVAPADAWTIYDSSPIYSAMTSATPSYNLAIIGQSTITASDVADFRAAAGLPPMTLVQINAANVTPPASVENEEESDADLEWSGAMAPNAQVVFVYSGNAIFSLEYAVDHDVAPVISSSYFLGCDAELSSSTAQSIQNLLQQANAQGQTLVQAAGDWGATGCDLPEEGTDNTIATHGLSADFPASVPEVTSVGGLQFNEGSGDYWNPTNTPGDGSAIGYIPEMVWNATAQTGVLWAGGGGVSKLYAKPVWQSAPGVPQDGQRDVPDIALNASNVHDSYLLCPGQDTTSDGLTSCTNGFADASGNNNGYSGTSVAAPVFAGILTAIEESEGISGLGNINPLLYSIANTPSNYARVFHDITVGNNQMPCKAGTTDCPNGGEIGYDAGPGYDLASGLGSVDAAQLATEFAAISPAGAVNINTGGVTPTLDQAVTYTAVIQPSTSGTLPTGMVQFSVNGTAQGSPVAVSNGSASFNFAATAVGPLTIGAAYSGDANYQAATATLQQTVAPLPTSVALTSSSLTPAPGAGFTVTAQVSSASAAGGALTGAVQFSVNGSNTGAPVPLSAAGTATFSGSEPWAAAYTVGASYSGATNYAGSSASVTETVTAGSTPSSVNIVLASASPAPNASDQVTVTVAGTAGAHTPTGLIQLQIDGGNVGGALQLSAGSATSSVSFSSAGAHTLTVVYSGDATYAGASANQPVQVSLLAAQFTVSLPNPVAGVSYTLTVSSTSPEAGVPPPSGTVLLSIPEDNINNTDLTLVNGSGTMSVFFPGAGTYAITLSYSGDSNYAAGTYPSTLVVAPAPSSGSSGSGSGGSSGGGGAVNGWVLLVLGTMVIARARRRSIRRVWSQ